MEKRHKDPIKAVMKTGIIDKNGREICLGDTIALPYVTPFGHVMESEDFRVEVCFFGGAFGWWTKTAFEPLLFWFRKGKGEYIPNAGNRVVYGDFIGWKIVNSSPQGDR